MKTLKFLAVFISAISGLVIAYSTGPLSDLGTVVAIDESYIQKLQHQYYYSGLVTATITFSVGYIFKANLKSVIVILLATGMLWVAITQSSDPEFLQYLSGAIFEFMVPYGLVCLGVAFATFGINKKWPRLS